MLNTLLGPFGMVTLTVVPFLSFVVVAVGAAAVVVVVLDIYLFFEFFGRIWIVVGGVWKRSKKRKQKRHKINSNTNKQKHTQTKKGLYEVTVNLLVTPFEFGDFFSDSEF